jgi:tetratricopeptide (TPR) repeat protein
MPSLLIPEPANAAPNATPHQQPTPPSPWIYSPTLDLIVGCGAWSAPLLLLAFFASRYDSQAWIVGFYFVALLFNYPHFMATVYRAYHTHREFAKYRIFTLHTAVLLLIAGVVAHLWYPLLPFLFTLYIYWSPWHYTGQNFGLLMMFARRSGISPTVTERRALRLAFVASFAILLLSFNTGSSNDALILSLGLAAKITLPLRVALAAVFFIATGWAFSSLLRRATFRALIPSMLLSLTQFLWFLLPALIELVTSRGVPQTRYSSGILAVLHSTQYLWITSYYQRKEARAAGDARWKFFTYLLTLVAGGIALFIPGPWIVSRLFHADFATSLLTFTALVNIHHFILDGALWKLRDSRVSSLLVSSDQSAPPQEAVAKTGIVAAARWFAGPTPPARALRIAIVVGMFAVAALDQLHFYLANRTDRLDSLQRAASLNPDDSTVQLRLAHAAELVGQRDRQMIALRRAAQINPESRSVQENFARGLVESGNTQEAYAHYLRIVDRWPTDADARVNIGLLAHQLGHYDEAADHWQRAIAVDPQQSLAQLYLAQLLEQQGQLQAAANHYRAYVQLTGQQPVPTRDQHVQALAIQLKIADADAAGNQVQNVGNEYFAIAQQAHDAHDAALESLAMIHLAELNEKSGDIPAAAIAYQRALTVDATLTDPKSVAADWLTFGQFLRRSGHSEDLVFACMLHAEQLMRNTPGDVQAAVSIARAESEKRLTPRAAAKVRATLPATLHQAVAEAVPQPTEQSTAPAK